MTFGTRLSHVAIVGAGVSGLRAADVLLSKGIKVTMFEARNRIGGRVAQEKIGGHDVDLGANWVQSASEHNPIYRLAKETGSILSEPKGSFAGFDEDATALSEETVGVAVTNMYGIIHGGMDYSRQHGQTIPANRSIRDFYEDEVLKKYVHDPKKEREYKRRILNDLGDMYGGYVASALETQSFRFLWLQDGMGGEDLFNGSSYKKVLSAVAAPAVAKSKILLNERVSTIETTVESGNTIIELSTQSGTRKQFDSVIVTLPLGVLQHEKNVFAPALPDELERAISNLEYGNLDKAYISFPKAFWDDASGEKDKIASCCWARPKYAPDTNPGRWGQFGISLNTMPKGAQQPTLLFYTYGANSAHLNRVVNATPAQDRARAIIDWFTPYFSLLPNYKANDPDCQASEAIATTWTTDELSGFGSYSNYPVGQEALDKDIETIRHGMPERGVWMAGEHTAPFSALGTVHGAYLSGERAAADLLQAHGISVDVSEAAYGK